MAEENSPKDRRPDFTRHENFENWYANNVQYESSEWDLKMIFGQLDQSGGQRTVEQHTAMTMSWQQAKICAYYLRVNILLAEMLYGKISLPLSIWPVEPTPPTEKEQIEAPLAQAAYELLKQVYDEWVAGQ
jgi:hypothetical protein